MKVKKILSLLSILVISVGLIGCRVIDSEKEANNEDGYSWKVLKTVDVAQKNTFGGFYNEKVGITVGPAGTVYYTNNGGEKWIEANNSSWCIFGLEMVSEKLALHCGNGGFVLKTEDGGKNWTDLKNFGKNEPEQCGRLSFSNEKVGWIGSLKMLGSTKDGGKSWTEIQLPSDIGNVLAMDLLEENTGYLISSNNKLYITNDNGITWDSKDLGISDIHFFDLNGAALRFTDENNGMFFYYSKESKEPRLKCLITKDKGDTWVEEALPSILPEGVMINGIYISNDGNYLSVNCDGGSKIVLCKKK